MLTHADAFQAMYRDQLSYVWCTLRRLGAFEVDLEDLTHETFTVAFRKRADYDPARPLKPWLFGIAYRVLLDFRRKDRRLHGAELTADVETDPAGTPEDALHAQQNERFLKQALSALDDERRALIVMHHIDGLSAPDIAAELQIPVNTVYSRLRLGRQQLEAAVKRLRATQERSAS